MGARGAIANAFRSLRRPLVVGVLTLVVAAPAEAAVKKGRYTGNSDQNRSMSFKVKGGKVRGFSAGVMTFCMAGGSSWFETDAVADVLAMKIRRGGRFSYKVEDRPGLMLMKVSGRIVGGRAKGKFTLMRPTTQYDSSEGRVMFGNCAAHDRKWTAKVG